MATGSTGTVARRKPVTKAKDANAEALRLLAEIGGRTTSDDDIVFEGKRFVIPESYGSFGEAAKVLADKAKEEEQEFDFGRTFRFRPMDGAVATGNALRKAFGFTKGKPIRTMFGTRPPQLLDVEVGVGATVQAPWGALEIPGFKDTTLYFTEDRDPELGPVFRIIIRGPKKYRAEVEGLFTLVQRELEENSIYRGKAVDGQVVPRFIDTTQLDPNSVVYTAEVLQQLQANVWSPIQHAEVLAKLNQPGKRAVLFEGPYGTGKSLASLLTAQIAVENGWTFLQCRPGRDDLELVLQTARMYQPAVVFFEDLDTLAEPKHGEADQMSRLLDLFDGVDTKNLRMLLVLTTNHVEKLHPGMLRPGRLDAVVSIGALDRVGVEKLTRYILNGALDENVDFDRVFEAMSGYMPAFVKEAIDRTVRYAVSRSGGEIGRINTDDLVGAANALRAQLALQADVSAEHGEHPVVASLAELVTSASRKGLHGTQVFDLGEEYPSHELRANTRIGR